MGRMNPSPQASFPCLLIGRKYVSLDQTPAGLGSVGRGRALQGAPPPTRRQASDPPSSGRAGRGGRRSAELGAVRRADHRGSWAGHGRLKNLTCCSSSLPFAPPRRAARALEKVLSVEPAPVSRADPGSGERALPVCPAPGLPSARARAATIHWALGAGGPVVLGLRVAGSGAVGREPLGPGSASSPEGR